MRLARPSRALLRCPVTTVPSSSLGTARGGGGAGPSTPGPRAGSIATPPPAGSGAESGSALIGSNTALTRIGAVGGRRGRPGGGRIRRGNPDDERIDPQWDGRPPRFARGWRSRDPGPGGESP